VQAGLAVLAGREEEATTAARGEGLDDVKVAVATRGEEESMPFHP
jgi:hypothetical protein